MNSLANLIGVLAVVQGIPLAVAFASLGVRRLILRIKNQE